MKELDDISLDKFRALKGKSPRKRGTDKIDEFGQYHTNIVFSPNIINEDEEEEDLEQFFSDEEPSSVGNE